MITSNGKPVTIQYRNKDKKEVEAATKWAKEACDRIFSHYTESEMQTMRETNAR